MADGIETFYFQRFIPAENRGGAYHVTIEKGGKMFGPLTPKEADQLGFPLSAIFAGINQSLALELEDTKAALAEKDNELAATKEAAAIAIKQAERDVANAREAAALVTGELTFADVVEKAEAIKADAVATDAISVKVDQ